MGRNTKWIDSRPDDSTQVVARRALRARLERMWYYLERAACEPQSETEDVHQLRVFARRTAAALEIFAELLPARHGRWMRKKLKHVRKAAGEARDIDVLLMRWLDQLPSPPPEQATLLLELVKQHRREAQQPIERVYEKLARKKFERRITKFVEHIQQRGDHEACGDRFECWARMALGRIVVPCLQAGEAELNDVVALHSFRIQAKQVRYAMEIFGGAFDARFRDELYPVVVTLQEHLGAINDHVTAHAYLERWRAAADSCATRQALEAGILQEEQLLESGRHEFLAWWTSERRQDLRRRFADYVAIDGTSGGSLPPPG